MRAINSNLSLKIFQNLAEEKVYNAAIAICRKLAEQGGRPYFVGGCVRNAVLGMTISDFDIEVFNLDLEKVEKILAADFDTEKTGKSFCVLKLKNFSIDISVPRAEEKIGEKHVDFKIQALDSPDIRTAAARRDFTINSIYFDTLNEKIFDEFNGMDDLREGWLRHVSGKFSEDPLRVLRGMQFASRFELSAAPETAKLCENLSISNISKERIFTEWEKLILKSVAPSKGLRFLQDTKWVKFFPEIERLISCEQDPINHPEGSVFEHICLSLDAYARTRSGDLEEDLILGLATLCHDLGKPDTTTYDGPRIHHFGHDLAGEGPTRELLTRINTPAKLIDAIVPLVRWHMIPRLLYQKYKNDSSVLQLANNVGRIDRLIKLCYLDYVGRAPQAVNYKPETANWLQQSATRLGVFSSKPKPIIKGRDLISLGLAPSEKFSKLLMECFEAQLNCEFTDHTSGMQFAKALITKGSNQLTST